MNRHEQVTICQSCFHHSFSYDKGIICSKTNTSRALDKFCEEFDFSPNHSQEEIDDFVEQQEKDGISIPDNIKNKTTIGVIKTEDITEDNTDTFDFDDILEKYANNNYVWVKKSQEEIEKEYQDKYSIKSRIKKSVKGGTIAFFIAILVRILMLLTIGPSLGNATGPKNPGLPTFIRLKELPDYTTNCLWLGLIGFAIVCLYIFFAPILEKESLPTFICDKCKDKRIQKNIGEKCECGGTFYSSNDYKSEYKNNS